jgi:hypothetical protein
MPNYFGLADQINKLSDRVAGLGSDRMAHEERMAGLGLTGVQLDNQRTAVQGQRQSELAKMEYEKYLDEPITVGSAISTSKRSAQEKRQMMETLKPFLNEPTTRRGFFERVNSAREQAMEAQKMKATEEYRKKQLQLDRDQIKSAEKIAGMRTSGDTGKPTDVMNQMKLQAWQDYMQGKSTPQQQDMIGINKDPYLTQAAQIVSQDFDTLEQGPEAIVKKVGAIADQLRVNRQQNPAETKQPQMELTREKAIEYLRKTNGDRDKAKQLASQDGYQF